MRHDKAMDPCPSCGHPIWRHIIPSNHKCLDCADQHLAKHDE